MKAGEVFVTIAWHATPFRGDKFEAAWTSAAEAALDYGASSWAFLRSKDDRLDFTQLASFPDKKAFERYWYSEELSEYRAEASGLYEVPILPVWFQVVEAGEFANTEVQA